MEQLFQWFWDLLAYISTAWNWLITPIEWASTLVGFNIAPIYLIGAGALTIGIIRAIA